MNKVNREEVQTILREEISNLTHAWYQRFQVISPL